MRVGVAFLSLCLTALPYLAYGGDAVSTRAVYTTSVLRAPDQASHLERPNGGAALVYTYFGNNHVDLTERLVYRIGGAALGPDGHIWTKMLCDDLTYTTQGWPLYFGAYMLNDIVAGFNSTTGRGQQVGINFRFYDSDGVNAMPGTLLYSYGILQNFDGGDFYSINEFSNPFLLPPIWELHPRSNNPLLWACVAFENLGNADADLDFMNNLGVLLWDGNAEPGTSQGLFFVTDAPWNADCPGDSPAGTTIENIHYNMHWQLQNRDYRALGGPFETLWQDGFDYPGDRCGLPYLQGGTGQPLSAKH